MCRPCGQWNLAPLEERWEAVEECQREYRSVRTRMSTAEIGLARLAVAVGMLAPVLVIGGVVAATRGERPAGYSYANPVRLNADDGTVVELGRHLLFGIEMRADSTGVAPLQLAMDLQRTDQYGAIRAEDVIRVTISGAEAVRAARLLIPRINSGGAERSTIRQAVAAIEDAGSVERVIPAALREIRRRGLGYSPIRAFPAPIRLGIEMALHEEAELRAFQGELADLEAAWREAERVAAIADDLLLPAHVQAFIEKHRRGGIA